jgi:hypothetical protein
MHLLSITFATPTERLAFIGYVTTRVYSPAKLFRKAFGKEMPEGTEVAPLRAVFTTALWPVH